MRFRRLALAVLALAFAAAPAVAQVTDSLPKSDKIAVEKTIVAPPQAELKVEPPPLQVSAVPEPGSILLLVGPAAVGWVAYWRRKWRADPNANGPVTQP